MVSAYLLDHVREIKPSRASIDVREVRRPLESTN